MANATADSYSAASGATVRGGRFGGTRSVSAVGNISSSAAFGSASVTTPSSGATLTTFTVQSSTGSGTYPFRIGLGFAKSETTQVACNLSNYQVEIKRTWNDGSVKHAIITGRAPMTSSPSTITVTNDAPPSGSALSFVLPSSTTVQLGSFGTANLSTATLVRTWSSGPELVEKHYRADVGTSGMSVWFRVRHYADGRKWVKFRVENGYLDDGAGGVATNVDRSYVPIVTLNGTIIYNNGGSSLTHYTNTTWFAEGWIGVDPAVTALHNTSHLQATKLVPNYGSRAPSSTVLNALIQTYTPMSNGEHTLTMGDSGYQPALGLLPNWEAMYCASGDARALRATLANSSHGASYPVARRSKTTNEAPLPSNFTTWSYAGPGGSGNYLFSAGTLAYEYNHTPSVGYLAYLLTGDYDHYETAKHYAAMTYFSLGSGTGRGDGTSRQLRAEQRGTAWAFRTLAQVCAISPDDDSSFRTDYQSLLSSNATYFKGIADTYPSGLGYVYSDFPYTEDGGVAPWMQNFWVGSMGMGTDIEPLSNMTNWNALRDFMYRSIVGMYGDIAGYRFENAGAYNIRIATTDSLTTQYSSWAQVHSASIALGYISAPTVNTLGQTPSEAWKNYWGNSFPALAYAVDHGATGAEAAYLRLTNASNYSSMATGQDDAPVWAVTPRTPPALPSWRTGQAVNEWREITTASPYALGTTDYANDNGAGGPSGFSDSANWIKPWCGLSIDTRTNKVYSFANGGHADYFGNEVNVIDLSDNSPTWTHALAASALSAIPFQGTVGANDTAYYADGRPASVHSYYSQQFIEARDIAFRVGGGAVSSSGNPKLKCDGFSITTNTCAAAGTYPDLPALAGAGPGVCKNPVTEDVYAINSNNTLYKWTQATNTWSAMGGGFPPSIDWLESASAYDISRDRIAFLKGANFAVFNVTTPGWTQPTLTGTAATALLALVKGVGMIYEPTLDSYLVKGGRASGGTVYSINASTWAVTTLTTTGGSTIPATDEVSGLPENVYGKWLYTPLLGGIIYFPLWSGNGWFLRTH